MKRTFYLLKTLLVAVGLCVGANAWATETNATLVHTASTWCGAKIADEEGPGANLYVKNAGGWVYAQGSVDGATEHYHNEGSGTYQGYAFAEFSFAIPDGESIVSATLTWKSTTSASGTRNHTIYALNAGKTLDYSAIAAGGILLRYNAEKSSAIYDAAWNSTKTVETDVTDIVQTIAASQNYIIFQWTRNAGGGDLVGKGAASDAPTLVIVSTSSTTSYTVRFHDESGEELKPDAVHSDVSIGATVSANASEKANFDKNDKTYTLKEGDSPITTVADAASNIITLVFKEASVFSYTVKGFDGSSNELGTIASGSYTEGTSAVSVAYPRYMLSGTTLYSSGSGNITYSTSFTPNANDYVQAITYNSGTVDNVVFYTEGEDVENVNTGTNTARASMGKMGYTNIDSDGGAITFKNITPLAPGKYKLYIRVQNGNNTTRSYSFKVGENVVFNGSFGQTTNGDYNTPDAFTVDTYTTLSFACVGSSSCGIDYIYVVKTGDADNIKATIAESGYTSLASAYGLDFANATDASSNKTLKAYVVSEITNTAVTLTSVESAPANTGVILKGTASTAYTIPVTASPVDVGTNKLSAAVTATAVEASTVYVVSGGELKLFTGTEIPAGKAYLLKTKVPNEARDLAFSFDDEATGINNVENARQILSGDFYNLAGQRVAQPAKGLFIVNGKKVVIK